MEAARSHNNTHITQWLIANTLGMTAAMLGIASGVLIAVMNGALLPEAPTSHKLVSGGFMVGGAVIAGIMLGTFQGRVFESWHAPFLWIKYVLITSLTIIASVVIAATLISLKAWQPLSETEQTLSSPIIAVVIPVIAGAILGALTGVLQGRVLRQTFTVPSSWVVTNMAGWAVVCAEMAAIPSILDLSSASTPVILAVGVAAAAVSGCAFGAITSLSVREMSPR